MTQTRDILVPLAVMVGRFEKQREQLRVDLSSRRDLTDESRAMLSGAIAVYDMEVDKLLELGGASQAVWGRK